MDTVSAAGATAGGSGYILISFAVIAMLSAGESTPLGFALAIGAAGVLAIEIGGIVFDENIAALLGYPLLIVVGLLTGRNRAAYRIQAEQAALLLAQHERLRAEQRRADVLDERTRIAREIHDVLAHSLGALGIQIQSARALLTDRGDVERALESLATAQRMASDGLTETRRAVHALRTDTLPLHEEIARAASQHAERHKVAVHCETAGVPLPVPPDATIALLRTAQEALVNAAKHAPGQDVEIRLDYGDEGIRLTVSNELQASQAQRSAQSEQTGQPMNTVDGGYGLTGMRERLRLLRGTLDAGPDTHQWIVTADLPLAP
jgi:signal transduction histidine kinase